MEKKMQDTLMRDKQTTSTHYLGEVRKVEKKPRGLMTLWAVLLLPATLGGAGLTVWKMRANDPEQTLIQQLQQQRDEALKAEASAKKQLEKVLAARRALEQE